uniref:Uncharacterized protein n=1 Tax=Anopheles maculatus TaxID=74869 RepID=A0A182SWM8_9DIPT
MIEGTGVALVDGCDPFERFNDIVASGTTRTELAGTRMIPGIAFVVDCDPRFFFQSLNESVEPAAGAIDGTGVALVDGCDPRILPASPAGRGITCAESAAGAKASTGVALVDGYDPRFLSTIPAGRVSPSTEPASGARDGSGVSLDDVRGPKTKTIVPMEHNTTDGSENAV